MHLSVLLSLGLLSAAHSATLTLRLPPSSPLLANPNALPPSTHATLTTLGQRPRTAPLSTANTFVFRNVTAGSYLADVHSATHAFAPLRVDVAADDGGVEVWETFRGNGWDNKGEANFGDAAGRFEVRVLGPKSYFMERSKFSIMSVLKNPMILLGLVSLVLFMGMPYLVDNMDPEMRAEWEERQKTNPMNGIMGAATGQAGGNPVGNFDMASFLAGSNKKEREAGSSSSAVGAQAGSSGGGGSGGNGGGGKKGKR